MRLPEVGVLGLLAVVVVLASASAPLGGSPSICFDVIRRHHPRQYVTYYTSTPPVLDGNLDEPVWDEVDYTDSFVDISTTTRPWLRTRVKIRWDHEWLYIGAHIEDPNVWANITSTCHCYNPNEDQVIFHGNDFEVFVDADASCHYYKEFEINAANASWDLCLDKPYEDGGYENSTRVYGANGFDMVPPLRSHARVLAGKLNDPSSDPVGWTMEIAFPLYKLAYNTTATYPPKNKKFWRINFSRVEWGVSIVNNSYWMNASCQSCPVPGTPTCDNWVWSPQWAIDMHHPEMWGILQFSTDPANSTAALPYVEWPVRYALHEFYYAQDNFRAKYGVFGANVTSVAPFATHPEVFSNACTKVPEISLASDGLSYNVALEAMDGSFVVTMTSDRYILSYPAASATTD